MVYIPSVFLTALFYGFSLSLESMEVEREPCSTALILFIHFSLSSLAPSFDVQKILFTFMCTKLYRDVFLEICLFNQSIRM